MEVDVSKDLERIDLLIDTLEASRNIEVSGAAAQFVLTNIIDDENPITYQIAANYLAWVIANGIPKTNISKPCICSVGWMEKDDGSVYPCERCRPEQHEFWWKETVDEDWMPS